MHAYLIIPLITWILNVHDLQSTGDFKRILDITAKLKDNIGHAGTLPVSLCVQDASSLKQATDNAIADRQQLLDKIALVSKSFSL